MVMESIVPSWNLKNSLCYNSRLSKHEFECVITDYCRGISASQSSREFKEKLGSNISRQTIAKYFRGISEVIAWERESYPWFSMKYLGAEITEEQQQEIWKIIYNKDRVINNLRKEWQEKFGSSKSVDAQLYIEILRKMSEAMNGLPKREFLTYIIRASEMAVHMELAGQHYLDSMYHYVSELFYDGHVIFLRKKSPTTQKEHSQYLQLRSEHFDQPLGPSAEELELKLWWNSLSLEERTYYKRLKELTAFDGSVKLPSKPIAA
jgi:hypothetical protein